eukprot:SAG11_NODE_1147_length_5683_cov_40.952006_3_plen_186_part_00
MHLGSQGIDAVNSHSPVGSCLEYLRACTCGRKRGRIALGLTIVANKHTAARWKTLGVEIGARDGASRSVAAVLRAPLGVSLGELHKLGAFELPPGLSTATVAGLSAETLEAECIYDRFLVKQAREAASLRRDEAVVLPHTLFPCVTEPWARALKLEVREKLDIFRPSEWITLQHWRPNTHYCVLS